MSSEQDTITALATPPGRGGIGVIRISGPRVPHIAREILGYLPGPRYAAFSDFLDARGPIDHGPIDQGIALYFPAPASFTGESVLELQGHGGAVVMDRLLKRVLALGARLARPGEFSERAFLNGKIDLVQAEAIADLIDSVSLQAARSAIRSLQGEFSAKINELAENTARLRSFVEAAIDFPDEEIDFLENARVAEKISQLLDSLDTVLDKARQGYLLKEGMHLVIIGRPNVGKSSLLNCLAGRDTAIVTEIAGTTRDIVRDNIHLDGMPLHITDTAGLRETGDPVEQEGMKRARQALETADQVVLLVDDRSEHPFDIRLRAEIPDRCNCLVVRNKCDLTGFPAEFGEDGSLRISAKTGEGLSLLKRHLKNSMGFHSGEEGVVMARRRHLDALKRARSALGNSLEQVRQCRSELAAEELRLAQQTLGEITGQTSADDLLDRIFSTFCIGK
ncbi:MAG: tRNA uridine-5-carboxymethylaminomethyl(34) synthesis GTPase MnmE [Gammaproteobacteria bacterium]|nr:tRNA uridine-5-carboxymethylaminomethyl(34) synthesis GTPase MnmE [Gammaproteobacteria bacterium]